MRGFHPQFADLPEDFPVFPLNGALLLPGGRLPLNVFEPRYLALVEDALGAGRMFGMVQPDKRLARGVPAPACTAPAASAAFPPSARPMTDAS